MSELKRFRNPSAYSMTDPHRLSSMANIARRLPRKGLLGVLLALLLLLTSGCSVRKFAIHKLGDVLAGGTASVFATDDDPELIRDALPFALKTIEALLAESPEQPKLLLAACQGFTQYAYAFAEVEAIRLEPTDYRGAVRQRQRALKLYLRGRDYCFDAVRMASPGLIEALRHSPETALAESDFDDVELMYWTAAAWGSAVSAGLDRPELVADAPAIRSLVERALELDSGYASGAIHEAMVVLESLPAHMGGSIERALHHFKRALALSQGKKAGPYVTWASEVSVKQQDRGEFERCLRKALDVDVDALPEERLANLVAQDLAQILLSQAEDLFFEEAGPETDSGTALCK